jgi:hypothetical protein
LRSRKRVAGFANFTYQIPLTPEDFPRGSLYRWYEKTMTFYAKNSTAELYHLVNEEQNATICGIPVAPIVIDRAAQTTTLHLTSKPPFNRALCQRCTVIQQIDEKEELTS